MSSLRPGYGYPPHQESTTAPASVWVKSYDLCHNILRELSEELLGNPSTTAAAVDRSATRTLSRFER